MTNITTEAWPTTPDVNLVLETQYRVYDGMLALGFCLCLLIGLPGNCLALKFFVQSEKRNLPTLLYMTASSIDIISSVIHLPLVVNLLNKRNPGAFGHKVVCSIWYTFILTLQLISMFVVMLLSLTRAIVIVFPFYKVKKKAVLIAIPLALLYFLSWNTMYVVIGDLYYSRGFAYCDVYFPGKKVLNSVYMVNCSMCSGIPPIIVFFSMIVAIYKLQTKSLGDESRERNRQASLTIIYFAAVFLTCNFLTFLNNTLFTYSKISSHSYAYFYSNTFLFFYSWIISEIFCTVLNAAVNPILYMCRMKEMREWVWSLLNFSMIAGSRYSAQPSVQSAPSVKTDSTVQSVSTKL